MRIHIVSAGRFDAGPERALYEHFAERFAPIGRQLSLGPLTLHEVVARGKLREADAMAAAIPGGAARIALDPRGKSLSSEELSQALAKRRDDGNPALAFLIGGADGLGGLREQADLLISFGAATWPHLLVRGMLAEQLYRSATILVNHPYHRGG